MKRSIFGVYQLDEIVGAVVLACIGVFIAVLINAGLLKDWFQPSFTLRILLPDEGVSGLAPGAEVQVLGTRAGEVRRIVIDPNQRMHAVARVEDQMRPFIRRDSKVSIRRQFGVAGAAFIDIARGTGPALNDLLPGRVDVMFNTMAGVLQQARSGQLRGLAVTTPKRFPTAPEFPTVADFVPGFDVSSWYAFLVPVKTPAEIVKKLHADTIAILGEPAIKSKLEQVGVMAIGSTPAELAAQLKSETEMWGPVIKAAGIKPEG